METTEGLFSKANVNPFFGSIKFGVNNTGKFSVISLRLIENLPVLLTPNSMMPYKCLH